MELHPYLNALLYLEEDWDTWGSGPIERCVLEKAQAIINSTGVKFHNAAPCTGGTVLLYFYPNQKTQVIVEVGYCEELGVEVIRSEFLQQNTDTIGEYLNLLK